MRARKPDQGSAATPVAGSPTVQRAREERMAGDQHFRQHFANHGRVRIFAHDHDLGTAVYNPNGRFLLNPFAEFAVLTEKLDSLFLAI